MNNIKMKIKLYLRVYSDISYEDTVPEVYGVINIYANYCLRNVIQEFVELEMSF